MEKTKIETASAEGTSYEEDFEEDVTDFSSDEEDGEWNLPLPESVLMQLLDALMIEWRDRLQSVIDYLEKGETEQALEQAQRLRDLFTRFIEGK